MNERNILEEISHPFIVKMHQAFRTVSSSSFNVLEKVPAPRTRSVHWGRTILPHLNAWSLSRASGEILLGRTSAGNRGAP